MIPNKLKKGDTIAVIAPSNAVNEDDIKFLKETEKKFNKYGINVIYGKNIYSNTLGYGATPREKANDLNEAFENKNVQAIFCEKGGENSNTTFEYINYEIIKKNPKIFCGFSDSTFLLNMIYQKTGLHINPYFSASKIRYLIDNNQNIKDLYDAGKVLFGTMDTYILYRLTNGASFKTDATNASRTMLYNIHTLSYDDELLGLFNIKKESLPLVMNSADNFGYANINGVKIPVCAMMGDQQASLFGHCAFNQGEIKNTYGTGCFMLLNVGSKPIMAKNGLLTTLASLIDGKPTYALEGSVFIAGAAVKWLRDSLKIIENSKETDERARKSHNNELIIVPSFVGMGTPYWDNDVRGAMFGLTLDTNQDDIIKATLESIAYESLDVFNVMASEANINKLSLSVDGGASFNDYLLQFQADILQSVIKRPRQVETTALGACYMSGLYTGFFKNYDEVRNLNQTIKMFYPIMSKEEKNKKYARWKLAIEACRVFK